MFLHVDLALTDNSTSEAGYTTTQIGELNVYSTTDNPGFDVYTTDNSTNGKIFVCPPFNLQTINII